jgi:hypothetical protein
VFRPALDAHYDLRRPTPSGAALLRDLASYCNLDLDTSVLDESSVDRDDWRDLLDQVVSCFRPQD